LQRRTLKFTLNARAIPARYLFALMQKLSHFIKEIKK